MNSYEAEEHKNDVEAGRRLPDVKGRLEELQRRIDEIDLMYIIRVEKEIREQRENIGKAQEENLKLHKEQVREEEQKSVIETDKLPLARREEETLSEKIRES
jgi:aspartate carbamoyltransferase catalytic subunit